MSSSIAGFFGAAMAYWRDSSTAQRFLFVSGSALLVSMLVHGVALAATGFQLHGPVSFRKAMTFAETGWLLCWAVGWLLPLISMRRWERNVVVAGSWAFAVIETFIMSLQVWRGRPSHYNTDTIGDALLFGTGGVIAFLLMLAMLVLLRASFRERGLAPSLLLSIRAGTMIMLIGVFTGWLMIYNWGGVWQGVFREGNLLSGDIVPVAEGAVGGDIVLLHALGVHGLNLVPLVAWLLSYSRLPEQLRYRITAAATVFIAAIIAVCAVGMLRSLPPASFGPVELALAGIFGLALLATYALAAWLALRGIQARGTVVTT